MQGVIRITSGVRIRDVSPRHGGVMGITIAWMDLMNKIVEVGLCYEPCHIMHIVKLLRLDCFRSWQFQQQIPLSAYISNYTMQ